MKLSRVICRLRCGKRFSLQIVENTGLPNTFILVKYSYCMNLFSRSSTFLSFRTFSVQHSLYRSLRSAAVYIQ